MKPSSAACAEGPKGVGLEPSCFLESLLGWRSPVSLCKAKVTRLFHFGLSKGPIQMIVFSSKRALVEFVFNARVDLKSKKIGF